MILSRRGLGARAEDLAWFFRLGCRDIRRESLNEGIRTMLPHRKLGNQGLSVSALGLGCKGMSQSYGAAEERDERE